MSAQFDAVPKLQIPQIGLLWKIFQKDYPSTDQRFLVDRSMQMNENERLAWLYETVNVLNSMLSLNENWDSYGARRVKENAAFTVINVMANVMVANAPLPALVPTSAGNVQLEWHRAGIDLEVEISSSDIVSIFFEDQFDGTETYENYSFSHLTESIPILHEFVQRISQRA